MNLIGTTFFWTYALVLLGAGWACAVAARAHPRRMWIVLGALAALALLTQFGVAWNAAYHGRPGSVLVAFVLCAVPTLLLGGVSHALRRRLPPLATASITTLLLLPAPVYLVALGCWLAPILGDSPCNFPF